MDGSLSTGSATRPDRRALIWAGAAAAAVALVAATFLGAFDGTPSSVNAPLVVQPIEFPHARHAGPASENGMEMNCLYCHTYARRSTVAGIPPLAKCMGCHRHIGTDKERIVALTEYWRARKPVPWKKVHDLPDFVHFTHERHVQRFVFEQGQPVQQVCGYCHGDVKTMTVAERKRPLTMGWCLSCHKQFQDDPPEAPLPARAWVIAATDQPLVPKPAKGAAPLRKAASDCWQCHK